MIHNLAQALFKNKKPEKTHAILETLATNKQLTGNALQNVASAQISANMKRQQILLSYKLPTKSS